MVSVMEKEVLSKHRKALMLFGTFHLMHGIDDSAVSAYEKDYPNLTGTGQNAIAEFGSEAYDLALNGFGVVFGAAVRNMTVGPSGMSTRGSSTEVEERWLVEQNEWFVG
jgi:hypothetical protein